MIELIEAEAQIMILGKNGWQGGWRGDPMYGEGTFPTVNAICISSPLNVGGAYYVPAALPGAKDTEI